MLDGLLGRGFSSKCKSLRKATATRIEVVRRRAEAKQRFLKEDLVKLLANGLENNAYGRTEEFLAGQSLLSCYDFIEQSYEYILKQLSNMQKQSVCPEDCRVAVASLMFAAARFSDLPELRDLRDLFQERYENSLECYVNQKFVEIISFKSFAIEKRIQVLQDIASEFSINWDSKGFHQRMELTQAQPAKCGPPPVNGYKYNLFNEKDSTSKAIKNDISHKERPDALNGSGRVISHKESNASRKDESNYHDFAKQKTSKTVQKSFPKEENALKADENQLPNHARELTAYRHRELDKDDNSLKIVQPEGSSRRKRQDGVSAHARQMRTADTHNGKSQDALSDGKSNEVPSRGGLTRNHDVSAARDHINNKNIAKAPINLQQEAQRSKSEYSLPPPYVKSSNNFLPPPYTKSKDPTDRSSRLSKDSSSEHDGHSLGPSPRNGVNPFMISDRVNTGPEHSEQTSANSRVNSHSHDKEQIHRDDIMPLPRPRSVRRKHHKSSSYQDGLDNSEDGTFVKRSSSSRRRDHSKKGLQVLFDDEHYQRDNEERMIDKLLLHYSKKPSAYDNLKLRKKSQVTGAGESSHGQTRDEHDKESDIVPVPTRSASLPHDQTFPSEAKKVFTRANSFEPDSQARHVHPKLPDYDDLAARFAALRGR